MRDRADRIGAVVTVALYALYILMFILRLLGRPELGHWIASLQFVAAVPLLYLLFRAPQSGRRALYYVQIVLMLAFLLVELLLDYVLEIDFRQTTWMVISYVTFFFAGTGGMLGIASGAGRRWMISAVGLYLIMAVLAFVQRAVTGL